MTKLLSITTRDFSHKKQVNCCKWIEARWKCITDCEKWSWVALLLVVRLFTAGFYAECDGCCHIFARFCVPGANRVGQMLSPKTRYSHHLRSTLSRCLRAKQKQFLSVCSLHFRSSIPTSYHAKKCGTNCPAKGLSRRHSHSQTLFSGPGKFQE